jgi:hypothetical protein
MPETPDLNNPAAGAPVSPPAPPTHAPVHAGPSFEPKDVDDNKYVAALAYNGSRQIASGPGLGNTGHQGYRQKAQHIEASRRV